MSDVRANIDELEKFQNNLRIMSEALNENYSKLRRQCSQINDTWRDQENAKFMEDFLPSADNIFKIAEQMMDYSKFIHRKKEILRDYTR